MEIKVGQWARTKNNHFTRIHQNDLVCLKETNGSLAYDPREKEDAMVIKVANTPQELIEVGDLVDGTSIYNELLNGPVRVTEYEIIKDHSMYEKLIFVNGKWSTTEPKRITKILTPNSRGGYDLRWEE